MDTLLLARSLGGRKPGDYSAGKGEPTCSGARCMMQFTACWLLLSTTSGSHDFEGMKGPQAGEVTSAAR